MNATTDDVLNDVVNNNNRDQNNEINKAAAIRKALQILNVETKPQDVVDYLKREHSVEVSAAYVSVVKGQLMRKVNCQTFEALRLARKLVKETGSINNARSALEALQEEMDRTASLCNLYEGQMVEIDMRLDDTERPLDQKDRRELTMEKKRIQKLLDALEES